MGEGGFEDFGGNVVFRGDWRRDQSSVVLLPLKLNLEYNKWLNSKMPMRRGRIVKILQSLGWGEESAEFYGETTKIVRPPPPPPPVINNDGC